MQNIKKLKIIIGLSYLLLLSIFLYYFFSKFSYSEISSYNFVQKNREYLINFKEKNFIFVTLVFIVLTITWVCFLGFGSPVCILGGFIFGKWLGFIIVALGLSLGAAILYIISKFFFLEFIKEKFLQKYQNLGDKLKKNELMFMIIFRIVGLMPFAMANVLPILFNVSLINYFIGSFIGMLPSIFIISSLGSGIETIMSQNENFPSIIQLISSSEIYIPIILFFLLLLIVFFLKKVFFKNN